MKKYIKKQHARYPAQKSGAAQFRPLTRKNISVFLYITIFRHGYPSRGCFQYFFNKKMLDRDMSFYII